MIGTSVVLAAEACPVCSSYNTSHVITNHYEYDTCPYTGGCTIVKYCRWEYEYCNVCSHDWDHTHTTLDSFHDDPLCTYR